MKLAGLHGTQTSGVVSPRPSVVKALRKTTTLEKKMDELEKGALQSFSFCILLKRVPLDFNSGVGEGALLLLRKFAEIGEFLNQSEFHEFS